MSSENNLGFWVVVGFTMAILFSFGVSVPMFSLVYPGDECLLFVSVRGEALIYGNPAGCNFIAYGHCIIIIAGKNNDNNNNLLIDLVREHLLLNK
jgi:hypothetical protein